MEQQQAFNRPRMRMASMTEIETARRRMIREVLEQAHLTPRATARHVEALIRAEFSDTFDWPTKWQLAQLVPQVVRQVEADPTRAETLAIGFGL